jgi:hypothetical protein
MGIISILRSGITTMVEDATKPDSFRMGEEFEDFVRENLFIDKYYVLVERTHNYATNHKDYVESSLKPDFTFRDRFTNKEFYVEAKVRATLYDGKIVWCNQGQLDRYNFYNKQKPVFLILDAGDENQFISLIPLSKSKYTGLFPAYARQFEIDPERPITSKMLWNR